MGQLPFISCWERHTGHRGLRLTAEASLARSLLYVRRYVASGLDCVVFSWRLWYQDAVDRSVPTPAPQDRQQMPLAGQIHFGKSGFKYSVDCLSFLEYKHAKWEE